MNCPNCFKPLDTSLTSCDRCGWQISPGMCVPRAEHERIVAEARNKALEEAAKVANDKSHWAECPEWLLAGIDAYRQRVVTAIRAMKGAGNRAAVSANALTNCIVCGRIIDTREESEGGDPYGYEYAAGWVCSRKCAGRLLSSAR